MATVVATGAVLCTCVGASALYRHTHYSITGRVHRAECGIKDAREIHEDILTVAAPKLKMTKEGEGVLNHCEDKRFELWRAKQQARELREASRQVGWFKRHFSYYEGSDLALLEERVRRFIADAVSTTALAGKIIEKGCPVEFRNEDGSDATYAALTTINEEGVDDTDLGFNE